MTEKKRFILIIALIALMAFIIMPVQAWTEYITVTENTKGQQYGVGNSGGGNNFRINDITKLPNITRMTFVLDEIMLRSDHHEYFGQNNYTTSLRLGSNGGAVIGWVRVDRHFDESNHATYSNSMEADVYILNTSIGANTGAATIVIYNCDYEDTCMMPMMNDWASLRSLAQDSSDPYAVALYDTSSTVVHGSHTSWYGTNEVTPVSGFSCNPTNQYPDTSVVCTDTSTNTPTSWLWTIDAEALGVDSWQTYTGQNFTWESHYPGFYSVNLQSTNGAGSDWENKSDYVLISANASPNTCDGEPQTGYSRTKFRCMNPANDATVFGCNIQLQDIQGGAWSNQTGVSTGIWCIDTLPGHFINAYSDATGYTSGSRLNVEEWNHMQYTIPLIPGYAPPPPAGNVSIYIYVRDFSNYAPVSGASVTVSGYGLPTKSGTTNTAGSATITWPNVSTAYINVAKAGYTTGAKVITTTSTGPDIVYIDIHKGTLTATLTPTPGPGGTTYPTAGPTVDPRSNAQKDADMMDQIRNSASFLIDLAILATMFGLVGLISRSMK